MMDYLCVKFGDRSFSRFGSIVRTIHADKETHAQTDADERFTNVTVVGVSNEVRRISSPDVSAYRLLALRPPSGHSKG